MPHKQCLVLIAATIAVLTTEAFPQCSPIDAITTASFSITGGEACSTYANLDWRFRRSNGTMTIEWGTSTAYGTSKSVYSANPVSIPNLQPNTQYFYHVYGVYEGRTHQYTTSSFTTAANTPVNNPPEITSASAVSCTTGTTVIYSITASDPDNDPVNFSVNGQPDWITFTSPVLTLKPVNGSNDAVVRIIASDAKGGFDTLNLRVTVTASTSVMADNPGNHLFSFRAGTSRIVFTSTGNHPVIVSLHSLNGSVVMRQTIPAAGIGAYSLPPAGISSGVYLLRLSDTRHTKMVTLNLRN